MNSTRGSLVISAKINPSVFSGSAWSNVTRHIHASAIGVQATTVSVSTTSIESMRETSTVSPISG